MADDSTHLNEGIDSESNSDAELDRRTFLSGTMGAGVLSLGGYENLPFVSESADLDVDFSDVEFFPLLKSKVGVARSLQTIDVVNSLEYMDEIRPALYNGEIRFPETSWPFLDPYPIEVDADGEIEVHDNQPLRDVHDGLQQRNVEIVHQLIGAPKQWHPYEEAQAPKKFPFPTDLEQSAKAMRLFTDLYDDTPITWTLWNEPSHTLTGGRDPEAVQGIVDLYEAYYDEIAPAHDKAVFGMANFIPWATWPLDELDGKSYLQAVMDEYFERRDANPDRYEEIGMERYTLNNYGPRVWRLLEQARNALGTKDNTLPLTLLQYGPFNPGRQWRQNAGTALEAVKSIDAFEEFLQIPDLNTVTFSGWIGHLLRRQGDEIVRLPLFNMLKVYSQIPTWRVSATGDLPDGVDAVAAADEHRAGVLLWSESGDSQTLSLNLTNLPERVYTGTTQVSVYKIDENHGSPLEGGRDGEFGPTEVATLSAESDSTSLSVTVDSPGITYVELDSGRGDPVLDRKGLDGATFLRKYSYSDRYEDGGTTRVRDSYGAYDAVRATAYTGVGEQVGRGICGAEYEDLPDKLSVDVETHAVQATGSADSILGVRVDYVQDGEAVKSALWHGDVFDPSRSTELPWGKGGSTADVLVRDPALDASPAENGDLVLNLAKHAPGGWQSSGSRAIVSFWTESTGEGSQVRFSLTEIPRPAIRTQVLDRVWLQDQMPNSYAAGGGGLDADPFEVTATFENTAEPDAKASTVRDLNLALTGIPDGWAVKPQERTTFDAVRAGEQITTSWEVVPETTVGDVNLGVDATFVIGGESYLSVTGHTLSAAQIARWQFNGDTADSSSYDHPCTLENGASFDDQVVFEGSHSVALDGTDDYILLSGDGGGFLHNPFSERTVAMWVKPNSTTGQHELFNIGGGFRGIAARIEDGTVKAGVSNNGNRTTVTAPFDSTDWTHVAVVFDRGALRLYVDGQQVAAEEDVGYDTVLVHGDRAELGGNHDADVWGTTDAYFDGHVDVTTIYSRALSADRLRSVTNS